MPLSIPDRAVPAPPTTKPAASWLKGRGLRFLARKVSVTNCNRPTSLYRSQNHPFTVGTAPPQKRLEKTFFFKNVRRIASDQQSHGYDMILYVFTYRYMFTHVCCHVCTMTTYIQCMIRIQYYDLCIGIRIYKYLYTHCHTLHDVILRTSVCCGGWKVYGS